MGDIQDRNVQLQENLPEQGQDILFLGPVHFGDGLIEEHCPRSGYQGPGKRHTGSVTPGEFFRFPCEIRLKG